MNEPTGHGEEPPAPGALDSIAALDGAYLDRQRIVESALEGSDPVGARAAAEAGADLRAIDAEGRAWRILGPLPTDEPRPHYRYRYRHQVSNDGVRFHHAEGFRFTRHPSLAASSADRLGGRALRWAVRVAEPAAYVAAIAVGAGLWLLLGDLIGSLPGIAVLAVMAVMALGLWWMSIAVDGIPFREASRLAQLTRLAAIGVTGAVAWAATIDAGDMTDAARVLVTATVVLVAAAVAFRVRSSADVWTVALVSFVVTVVASSIVVAELIHDAPDEAASAQLGALVATAAGVSIAGPTMRLRWVPFAVPFLGAVGAWALLGVIVGSPNGLHTILTVVLGAAASAATLRSGLGLPASLQAVHRTVAAFLAALTAIVVVAQVPWDDVFSWLEDVPLPVVLIVGGSVALVAIGLVIRAAVRRLDAAD